MADTRKDRRAPLSLKVRFKSATVDEFIEQYAMDISRGGIFIKSKKPMPIGTLLKFEFQLKDESRLIHGVGRVVWKRDEASAAEGAPPGMGIKFIKMDPNSRAMVQKIISVRGEGEGQFETGGADPRRVPSRQPTQQFFPSTTPEDELPPPEDRTQVRHASEFLASALSGADEDAAAEAQQKAEDARRRTEEIQRRREAEAAQQKADREARERAEKEARERAKVEAEAARERAAERAQEIAAHEAQERASAVEALAATALAAATEPAAVKSGGLDLGMEPSAVKSGGLDLGLESREQPAMPLQAAPELSGPDALEQELDALVGDDSPGLGDLDVTLPSAGAPASVELDPEFRRESERPAPFPGTPPAAMPSAVSAPPEPRPVASRLDPELTPHMAKAPTPSAPVPPPPEEKRSMLLPIVIGLIAILGIGGVVYYTQFMQPTETVTEADPTPEPEPEIPTVAVAVSSEPPGATIYVDGRPSGTTPNDVELPIGQEANLAVRLRGYSEVSQQITAAEADNEPLAFELEEMAYAIVVRVEPENARVTSPGLRLSEGEFSLRAAPTGPIELTAVRAGYDRGSHTVALEAFEEQDGRMVASVSIALNAREVRPTPNFVTMMTTTMESTMVTPMDTPMATPMEEPATMDAPAMDTPAMDTPVMETPMMDTPMVIPPAEDIPDNPFG
ncbi:MAG: TIGR02266 family protein [Myxococcota bacterium]